MKIIHPETSLYKCPCGGISTAKQWNDITLSKLTGYRPNMTPINDIPDPDGSWFYCPKCNHKIDFYDPDHKGIERVFVEPAPQVLDEELFTL